MYVSQLDITELRSFVKASFTFRTPDRRERSPSNVNLFLGDNGTGKTTVLKAIALAVLAPIIGDSGFRPYFLVRKKGKGRATVTARCILHSQDVATSSELALLTRETASVRLPREATLGVRIARRGDYESISSALNTDSEADWERQAGIPPQALENMFQEESAAFFLVAYGATRRVDDSVSFTNPESSRSRSVRYQRVAGLFESQVALVPLSTWLPELPRERFDEVKIVLNSLLPKEATFLGKIVEREYQFKVHGQEVPFGALSDGYRAYISWVSDLLYYVVRTCPKQLRLIRHRGIVLVDEIDLHLHPQWQKTVIPALSAALPSLQFFLTTHSPIVASSLHHENIFIMSTDENGDSTAAQLEERIYGLSSDQALESPYFGLQTSRPDSFIAELNQLTGQTSPSDPDAALALMRRVSGIPLEPKSADQTRKNRSSNS